MSEIFQIIIIQALAIHFPSLQIIINNNNNNNNNIKQQLKRKLINNKDATLYTIILWIHLYKFDINTDCAYKIYQ